MFSRISLETPFIQEIIAEFSERNNLKAKAIQEKIAEEILEKMKIYSVSELLFKNTMENMVEGIVFNECLHLDTTNLFKEDVFYELKNLVIIENPGFFPLRDGYSKKIIKNSNWFLVPTSKMVKLPKKMEECPTAMVTSSGDMVFNRLFCEKLCKYAKMKNIRANGKKYVSNGGKIPDYYEYIEFLLLHEYMHIIHGDVFYVTKFKKINKKIQNIVGDLIINYKLLKMGYNQPPIGMFNENINYDKYNTIEEMRKVVEEELSKLKDNENQLDKMEEQSEMMDIHDSGDFEDFEKLDDNVEFDDNIDDNQSNTEEEQMQQATRKIEEDAETESSKFGNSSGTNVRGDYFEIDEIYKPQYKWNQLLKKILPLMSVAEDYSYSKISKKVVSSLKQMKEIGVSSAKPGIIKLENNKKGIVFVIDNSGSVMKELAYIKKELLVLLKSRRELLSNVYMIKFDNKMKMYELKINQDKYLENVDNNDKSLHVEKKDISAVFKEKNWGGSTILSKKVVYTAFDLWQKNYNIVLFSDGDIVSDEDNYRNLKYLLKSTERRKNSFAIITTKSSYETYVKLNLNNVLLSSFD